jgi:hypothetical protein
MTSEAASVAASKSVTALVIVPGRPIPHLVGL